MASFNKVILMGNLTRDPEIRYTTGGSAVCSFGLAMNRRYTTGGGEQRDETVFVDIEAWGRLGETVKNYLHKGSQALVEGRLRMDQWQDRETGKSRSRLSVTADNIRFLGAPTRGEFGDGQQPQTGGYRQQAPRQGGYQQPQGGGYQQQAAPQGQNGSQQMPPFESAAPQAGNAAGGAGQSAPPPFEQPDNDSTLDDIPF